MTSVSSGCCSEQHSGLAECASERVAGLEITQGNLHQNRVGLLQGPPKDKGKSVLPLSWLWPHGCELPEARPKQKSLRGPARSALEKMLDRKVLK